MKACRVHVAVRGLLQSVGKLQQTTSEGAVPLPLEAVISNLRHRAEQLVAQIFIAIKRIRAALRCAVLADELDQELVESSSIKKTRHFETF